MVLYPLGSSLSDVYCVSEDRCIMVGLCHFKSTKNNLTAPQVLCALLIYPSLPSHVH